MRGLDITKVNPETGQNFTPAELAEISLNQRFNQQFAYGELESLKAGSIRELVPDATNDFFEYSRSGFIVGNDNEETRAQLQPWYEQLGNATVKMGGLAATTFLDGTIGLVAGLGNMAVSGKDQGVYNAFINNPFSNWMVDLQEDMEKALPNYRTKEEEENAFYENMLSGVGAANFWGDTVLKNAGFAVGAIGAGMVTFGVGAELSGLNRLMKSSKYLESLTLAAKEGKVLSQAEVAAAKTLTSEGLASAKAGDALLELDRVSKAIKAKTAQNQLLSSFIGSVGEGRIEALHNSREFQKARTQEYDQALKNGLISREEYDEKLNNLDKEILNYQNSLFSANVALLSLSNYTQFRNVFAKGFSPNKIASDAITTIEKEGLSLYELTKRSRFQKTFDAIKLLKNPLAEMTEEQGQYAIQKAADTYYSMKLDNEANATVKNMIFSVGQGLREAYGSEQGWENGFVGMVIGGFGVPTIMKKESGKYGLGIAGGIRQDYKEQKTARERLEMGVDTANELIKDSMTRKLYDSAVVDVALEKKFNQSVQENDRLNGNTISAMQLANMVDAFTQIGKYDDLVTRLQDENNLSAAELRQKYRTKAVSPLTGREEQIDFFNNMTDEQVKIYIKEKSETAIARAEKIKKIRENIDIRFTNHSEDARKDMLLKSAAIVDMDERIAKLLDELKVDTANNFYRGLENLKKNLSPEEFAATLTNLAVSDFSDFATPVDLEQFLKKQNGLANYERLIKEYVDYQTDVEKKISFTEKARDLYGLIAKRQAFNDIYFKMSDPEYAANQDAANQSERNERELASRASSERRLRLYKENTSDDPEFGFDSTEFEVVTGQNEINTVRGVKTKEDGTKEEMGPIQFTSKDDEVRTSKTGDKYQTYYYIDEKTGKEKSIDIANPVEDSRTEDQVTRLKYSKNGADRADYLYDQNGNKYKLDDLVNDPTFMKSKAVTIGEQRQQIINGVRQQTLQQLFDNNAEMIKFVSQQIATAQEAIDTAKALLARARANKSGTARMKINGKTTVFTILGLENSLRELEAALDALYKKRQEVSEQSREALYKMRQAEAGGFTRGQFAEDIAAVEKQGKALDTALQAATTKVSKLKSLISRLKNLVGVVYPKFKKMYRDIHGVDPSEEDYQFVKQNLKFHGIFWWANRLRDGLDKLKAEESSRLENISVKEQELAAAEQEVKDLEKAIEMNNQMLEALKAEQKVFEDALAKVLAARRAAQSPAVKKAEEASKKAANPESKGIDEEITAEEEPKREKFSLRRLMKSIMNIFSTTGRHIIDGKPNPIKAQQRWYNTAAKVNLGAGNFSLRVVTNAEPGNEELFKDVPADKRDEAIAVILYKDGVPIGEDLQPVGETDVNKLVYTFLPLPTLESDEFGNRYFDSETDPEVTKTQLAKLQALRDALLERSKNGVKGTFLKITGKSLGVLNINPVASRKNPDNDTTRAIMDVLFQGTDEQKAQQYNGSKVVIGKAADTKQQEEGIATIYVGGKEVTVVNGLPYLITNQGNVIPLMSRKVTEDEVETILELLEASIDSDTILTSEGLEAEEKKEKEEEKKEADKKVFVPLKVQDSKKVAAAKKRGKFLNAFYDKKRKKWGYLAVKSVKGKTKKVHGADTNSIKIFEYIGRIVRFGKQTKAADSTLATKSNEQTEIFVEKGELHYFDPLTNKRVQIPFTKEGLEQNRESLKAFLATKYHQVSSDLLSGKKEGGEFVVIDQVFKDSEGTPYVEVTRYTTYKAYLLSKKQGKGKRQKDGSVKEAKDRPVSAIPLTTNLIENSEAAPMVRSVYFTFAGEVDDIMDSPTGKRKDKPTEALVTDESRKKKEAIVKEIDQLLATKAFELSAEGKSLPLAKIEEKAKEADKDFTTKFEALEEEDIRNLVDPAEAAAMSEVELDTYIGFLAIKTALLQDLESSEAAVTAEEGEGTTLSLDELRGITPVGEETTEEEDEEGFDSYEDDDDLDESAPFRTQTTGGSTINIEQARENLNRMLPQVPVKIREKLINGIAQGKVDMRGVLHLSQLAEEGAEYHEALHSVMLGILSDEELAEVYTEARRLYGKPSEAQLAELRKTYPKASAKALETIWLDENLAEDYRTYALSGGKITPSKKMKGFFQTIWDTVKAMLGLVETKAIDNMFATLYTGGYANAAYDTMKVKERIQTRNRYMTLPFTKNDPVKNEQRTKEVVDGVTYYLFRDLLKQNSSVNDLSRITKGVLQKLVEKAMISTAAELRLAPKSEDPETMKAREFLLKQLSDPKGKELISKATQDFIQRSLGVDLGIDYVEMEEQSEFSGNEEKLAEDSKTGKDSIGSKDSTTISPRDGSKAFVKLMVAALREGPGVVGDTYGLPKLVNPNKAFNNIMKYMHPLTTVNEMIAKLNQMGSTFPYMADLARTLQAAIDKGDASSIQMVVNFQQSMYKANINYRTWLVNEFDVVDTNPNSERQEMRISQNWKQTINDNLGTKNAFVEKNKGTRGQLRFVRTKVQAILQDILKETKTKNFDYYIRSLNALGFTMTDVNYSLDEMDVLMENAEWLLSDLSNVKSKKENLFVEEFFNNNRGRLETLAKLEAARNGEATDMQHIRADGKSIYGIIEHNMVSQVAEFLNNMPAGTKIEVFFQKFPQYDTEYLRNSHLLNNVLFRRDVEMFGPNASLLRTTAPFKVSIIEAARINRPGEQGEVNTKLDKADRLWIMLNSVLRNVFPVIRTSDKSLEYGLETPTGITVENISEQNSNIFDIFRGYLRDELAMGQNEDADNIQHWKGNKGKGVSPGVYFFQDILANSDVRPINPGENIDAYLAENRQRINIALAQYFTQHDMKLEARMLEAGMIELNDDGSSQIYALNLTTKEQLNIGDTNKISAEKLGAVLRTLTVNSLIANIEQTKLFFGHPAFYKNTTDLLKRTAGAVGTKTVGLVDPYINAFMESDKFVKTRGDVKQSYDGSFQTIIVQEPKGRSRFVKQYREMLVATYGKEIGNQFADAYLEYDEADGQGYITLPEYRELLYRNGEWSDNHEALYQKLMQVDAEGNPVKLSEKEYKDLNTYFNPLKTMYYGFNKVGNVAVPTYLKHSLMPLIPAVYAGTQIEGFAESMMERGIGVMMYPSGAKVGAMKQDDGEFTPLYDEETGDMIVLSPDGEMPVMNLDYRFMGIQVSTGYQMKEKATVGTQHRKISIGNLFEGGRPIPITLFDDNGKPSKSSENTQELVDEYHDTVRRITDKLAKEVLDEVGAEQIREGVYKIKDFAKLAKKLRATAYDRNQVDNIINSFATVKDEEGVVRFKYLLDAVPGRNKIENLLFSLINNTVVSQKFVGSGKVQAASTGFEKESRTYEKGKLLSNPDLRFYTVGKYGETLPMQVRLVADKNLQKIIDANGGREEVNRKLKELWALEYDAEGNVIGGTRYDAAKVQALGLDPAILQTVAFRIPTDSRATTEMVEIAEFLDPAAGEAIHVPSELVVKSGGDFDIDKLTIYFNSVDKEGNLVRTDSLQGLQNKLIDITKKIFTSPEVFSDLMAPVSAAKLKELADKVESPKKVSSTESLTMLYHLDQGEYFLVGKAGVGIIARHGTSHTLAQQSDLNVKKGYVNRFGKPVSTKMNFEGLEDDYSLSKIWDVRGQGKGFKISQILSQFLQAFVDVARDPFIFRMNGSTRTADIYAYLVRRGVPIETAVAFMNQPVIKELYKRLAGANALFKQGKRNSEGEKLVDSFSDIEAEIRQTLVNMAAKVGLTLEATTEGALTQKILDRHIDNENPITLQDPRMQGDITFLRTQWQVLNDFQRYLDNADQLRQLMDITSDDTVRPKNFNALDTMLDKEVPAMFDEEQVDALYDKTFLGAFKKAHTLSETFREMFMTEMNVIRSQFGLLRAYLSENGVQGDDLNKIMDKAKNDFIVYAFMNHPKMTKSKALEFFKGEKSFPRQMMDKIRNKKLANENPFIKNLYALLENPQSLVDNLKMFNTRLTVHEHNEIVAGLKALRKTKNGESLLTGAAVFALVQSGLDNSPITWYDKIPVEIMHELLAPGVEVLKASTTSPTFQLQDFFHQFIRNNFINSELVPTLGKTDFTKEGGNWNFRPDSQGKVVVTSKKHSKRMYLKLRAEYVFDTKEQREEAQDAGIPVSEYLLLMRVQGDVFQLVSKQGSGMYMKEYGKVILPSSLPENNPDQGMFGEQFPNYSEPNPAPFQGKDTKDSTESLLGKETKKKCKGK
jgi:hypothetical protein